MSDRETFGSGGSMPPPGIDREVSGGTGFGSGRTGTTGGGLIVGGSSSPGSQGGSGAGQAKEQAGQVADQAKEKATQAAGQAKEMASQATDTAKEKAGQVAEQASAKADQGIDKAAGGLDKAADMLREKTQGMEGQGGAGQTAMNLAGTAAGQLDKAARYLEGKDSAAIVADLEGYVRQKPSQALLIAAGVGFLLRRIVR